MKHCRICINKSGFTVMWKSPTGSLAYIRLCSKCFDHYKLNDDFFKTAFSDAGRVDFDRFKIELESKAQDMAA